ncbi:transmembrane protease serine 2 [Latimeria chalumnae]|uniref:transmembrane protease serine 2 n=1 Tax=Latimeria chalumnae TaxID=7897 RepID=UPI00313D236C
MAEKVPCSPFYSLRLNESNDVTKNAQLNSVNRELQKSQLTIFDGIGLMETFKMTITDFALHLQEKQDFSVFNELSQFLACQDETWNAEFLNEFLELISYLAVESPNLIVLGGSRSIVITVVVLVVLVLAGIAAALIYYFVRLYGPSFLLQAYSAKKQSWEPVCSDNWTNNYGQAICSQIGYESYSDPKQWRVYSGILKRSEMNIWKGNFVAKIIAHKGYNSKTKHKDIALMKLESPLTFSDTIRPVCLPNFGQQFLPDTTCWISGWGSTREGGSSSNDMMVASVPIISTAECNSRLVYNGMISSTMTCAGYLIGGIDSCQGDSGGPLVTQQHSSWWLVGVTSWGEGCARRNRPGVYGKVTELLDWIYLTMQAN